MVMSTELGSMMSHYENHSSAPGCKRLILDPGYLDCLHQPNVSLNWSPIESIVGEGIQLKNGDTVPLDVIIFATGYSLVKRISRVVSGETDMRIGANGA
jgi:cation diffusion facilitator CzcD-associated flavoprotein CzcO